MKRKPEAPSEQQLNCEPGASPREAGRETTKRPLSDQPSKKKTAPAKKSRLNYTWLQRNTHQVLLKTKQPAEQKSCMWSQQTQTLGKIKGRERANATEVTVTEEATHIPQGWASNKMTQDSQTLGHTRRSLPHRCAYWFCWIRNI